MILGEGVGGGACIDDFKCSFSWFLLLILYPWCIGWNMTRWGGVTHLLPTIHYWNYGYNYWYIHLLWSVLIGTGSGGASITLQMVYYWLIIFSMDTSDIWLLLLSFLCCFILKDKCCCHCGLVDVDYCCWLVLLAFIFLLSLLLIGMMICGYEDFICYSINEI